MRKICLIVVFAGAASSQSDVQDLVNLMQMQVDSEGMFQDMGAPGSKDGTQCTKHSDCTKDLGPGKIDPLSTVAANGKPLTCGASGKCRVAKPLGRGCKDHLHCASRYCSGSPKKTCQAYKAPVPTTSATPAGPLSAPSGPPPSFDLSATPFPPTNPQYCMSNDVPIPGVFNNGPPDSICNTDCNPTSEKYNSTRCGPGGFYDKGCKCYDMTNIIEAACTGKSAGDWCQMTSELHVSSTNRTDQRSFDSICLDSNGKLTCAPLTRTTCEIRHYDKSKNPPTQIEYKPVGAPCAESHMTWDRGTPAQPKTEKHWTFSVSRCVPVPLRESSQYFAVGNVKVGTTCKRGGTLEKQRAMDMTTDDRFS